MIYLFILNFFLNFDFMPIFGYLTKIFYYIYENINLIKFILNLYNFRIDLIKKLIYLNHEIYITVPKDEYFQKIINLKLKIKVNQLNIDRKSFNIFKNLYLLFQYLKIYNKIKPDLVLLYTIKPNIIGSIASFFSFKKIKIYNFITGLGTFIFENNLKKR